MINHEPSAHTYGDDRPGNDPYTALRVIRRSATGVAVTLIGLGLAALATAVGLTDTSLWHLGLLLIGVGSMSALIAVGSHIGELIVREQAASHRCAVARVGRLEQRMDAIEAGERAIAGAISAMPDGGLDEVARRRSIRSN